MPTFKQTLQDTYMPLQAAEARWTSAKTTAGAAFAQLAAEEKALEEIALRRQQYAETIRPRESNDAFLYQAIAGLNAATPPGGGGGGTAPKRTAFDLAYDNLKGVKEGANFGRGGTARVALDKAYAAAVTVEDENKVKALAVSKGAGDINPPPRNEPLPTLAEVKAKAAAGDAKAKAILAERQVVKDTAENLGARAFEGGQEAQDWYEALPENKRQMLNVFASALLDDGRVTANELGDIDPKAAQDLYNEAKSRKAYRRQDRAAYDPRYLELSRIEAEKRGKFEEKKAKLGQTPEELALKLYRGTADGPELDPLTGLPIDVSAKIPPLLRELKPDMEKVLGEFEASGAEDFEAWALKGADKKARAAYTTASNMAKEGKGASEIQAMLAQSGLPVDVQRGALVTLASRDLVNQTRAASAPGSAPETVRDVRKVDEQAKRDEIKAEQTKVQMVLDKLDKATRDSQRAFDAESRTIPELMDRVSALEESTAIAKTGDESARRQAMLSALYASPPAPEVPSTPAPVPPSGGGEVGGPPVEGPPAEEGSNLGGLDRGSVGYTFTDESDPAKSKYERTETGFKALTGPYAGREFLHGTKPGTALAMAEKEDYEGLKRMSTPKLKPTPTFAPPKVQPLTTVSRGAEPPAKAAGPLTPVKASDALIEAILDNLTNGTMTKGSDEYKRAMMQVHRLQSQGL